MSHDTSDHSTEQQPEISNAQERFDAKRYLAHSVIAGIVRNASRGLVALAHDRIIAETTDAYENAKDTFDTTQAAQEFIAGTVRNLVQNAPAEERIAERQAA